MSIIQIPNPLSSVGNVGVNPRNIPMVVSDDFDTVTAAGYLNQVGEIASQVLPTDIFQVFYDFESLSSPGTYDVFTVSIATSGVITLVQSTAGGGVELPVTQGHVPTFLGDQGMLQDDGYVPCSSVTKTLACVSTSPPIFVNRMVAFQDVYGTIGIPGNTIINSGPVQSGITDGGVIGTFDAISQNGNSGGRFRFIVTNNSGNYTVAVTNASMGQSTIVTVPDPAQATATFALTKAALVDKNVVVADGITGLVKDGGYKLFTAFSDTWGGGGTSFTFTTPGVTLSSIVVPVIAAQAGTASIVSFNRGTGTLAVTFSADPGAGTILSYMATSAPVAP